MSSSNVKQKQFLPSQVYSSRITDLILDAGKPSWFSYIIYGWRQSIFIVGSHIYKNLLRSEKTTDIDAVCSYSADISNYIRSVEKTAYNPIRHTGKYSSVTDYRHIKFSETPELTIDLIGIRDFAKSINNTGLSMANCLVLTPKGIQHVFEVPEINKYLNLESQDPVAEREWAIKNIKAGKYCKWSGMRKKDVEYFKNWTAMDFQECNDHGMFQKN